jgi:hypothetical protein
MYEKGAISSSKLNTRCTITFYVRLYDEQIGTKYETTEILLVSIHPGP